MKYTEIILTRQQYNSSALNKAGNFQPSFEYAQKMNWIAPYTDDQLDSAFEVYKRAAWDDIDASNVANPLTKLLFSDLSAAPQFSSIIAEALITQISNLRVNGLIEIKQGASMSTGTVNATVDPNLMVITSDQLDQDTEDKLKSIRYFEWRVTSDETGQLIWYIGDILLATYLSANKIAWTAMTVLGSSNEILMSDEIQNIITKTISEIHLQNAGTVEFNSQADFIQKIADFNNGNDLTDVKGIVHNKSNVQIGDIFIWRPSSTNTEDTLAEQTLITEGNIMVQMTESNAERLVIQIIFNTISSLQELKMDKTTADAKYISSSRAGNTKMDSTYIEEDYNDVARWGRVQEIVTNVLAIFNQVMDDIATLQNRQSVAEARLTNIENTTVQHSSQIIAANTRIGALEAAEANELKRKLVKGLNLSFTGTAASGTFDLKTILNDPAVPTSGQAFTSFTGDDKYIITITNTDTTVTNGVSPTVTPGGVAIPFVFVSGATNRTFTIAVAANGIATDTNTGNQSGSSVLNHRIIEVEWIGKSESITPVPTADESRVKKQLVVSVDFTNIDTLRAKLALGELFKVTLAAGQGTGFVKTIGTAGTAITFIGSMMLQSGNVFFGEITINPDLSITTINATDIIDVRNNTVRKQLTKGTHWNTIAEITSLVAENDLVMIVSGNSCLMGKVHLMPNEVHVIGFAFDGTASKYAIGGKIDNTGNIVLGDYFIFSDIFNVPKAMVATLDGAGNPVLQKFNEWAAAVIAGKEIVIYDALVKYVADNAAKKDLSNIKSTPKTEQTIIAFDTDGSKIEIPKSKFNANGYSFKGEVDTPDQLPPDEDNQVGDQYRVTSEKGVYTWDGNRWFFYLADGNSFDITQFTNVKIIP